MFGKLTRKISLILIMSMILGRVVSPFAVLAQESAPTAPSAPENSYTAPTAPSSPENNYTAPSAPTGPSAPSANTSAAPTSPPQPTGETLPTGEPLPTGQSLDPLLADNPDPTGQAAIGGSGYSSQQSADGSYFGNDPYNLLTGPYSTNFGQEIIDAKMETVNQNLAQMQNKIDAITSTGFNYADLNTLDGKVFTGDILATVNLLNKLNSNITGIGGFSVMILYDNYLGDLVLKFSDGSPIDSFSSASATIAENSTTGPYSDNTSISDGNFTVKEVNGNDASINNDINLKAVTGNNSASFNTGDGVIQSGDAVSLANIINLINSNITTGQWLFGVINIFGTLIGDIILPQDDSGSPASSNNQAGTLVSNNITGPNSDNYASAETTSTSEFTNNNNADLVSNLSVDTNTRHKFASFNTGIFINH